MRKRIISIGLVLSLCFSLTGCGLADELRDKIFAEKKEAPKEDKDSKDTENKESSHDDDFSLDFSEFDTEFVESVSQTEVSTYEFDEKTNLFSQGSEIIEEYGYGYYNESNLSFSIIGGTVKEFADYFRVDVYYERPVKILNPQPGVKYTIVTNSLNGESFVGRVDSTGTMHDDYGTIYTIYGPDSKGEYTLYYGSDDLLYCTFYQGVLRVSKEAITGAVINSDYHTVTIEELSLGNWFNRVSFDSRGYAAELLFVGD